MKIQTLTYTKSGASFADSLEANLYIAGLCSDTSSIQWLEKTKTNEGYSVKRTWDQETGTLTTTRTWEDSLFEEYLGIISDSNKTDIESDGWTIIETVDHLSEV